MTWTTADKLDELRAAVRIADAGDDSHTIPDRPPAGESGEGAKPTSFTPAPIDVLPPVVYEFITQTAASIRCAPGMVLAPVLGVLAGAIGNRRRISLSPDWDEPNVLWLMTVAPPSSMKSPALEKAAEPLQTIQRRMFAEWRDDLASHEESGCEGPKPIPERVVIGDITIEAVADRLADNWPGLTLIADEGSTWLGGFDRYRQHGRTDAAQWCSIWSAKPITVDRKSGDRKVIRVERPCVSIVGTSQPETLRRCLTEAFFESGLAARLILVSPPPRRKRWRKGSSVDRGVIESMQRLVESLLALSPVADENGEPAARLIGLDEGAESEWCDWYDSNARREEQAGDDRLRGLLGKTEAHVARLALILHCVRIATGELGQNDRIDAVSVAAAIELGEWLCSETWRVWLNIAEPEEVKERRELAKWVAHRGGATVHDLSNSGPRRFRGDGEASEAALDALVGHGFHWEQPPQRGPGGPKARRLVKDSPIDWVDADSGTPDSERETGIVESTSSGDAGDDWGSP